MGTSQETIWLLTVTGCIPAYPWVEGSLEETLPDGSSVGNSYRFQAKVFNNTSKFGINHGRISKLTIWKNQLGETPAREIFVNYDRGWDVQPIDETAKDVLQRIVTGLEESPKQQIK